jgi:hypothetical protein
MAMASTILQPGYTQPAKQERGVMSIDPSVYPFHGFMYPFSIHVMWSLFQQLDRRIKVDFLFLPLIGQAYAHAHAF